MNKELPAMIDENGQITDVALDILTRNREAVLRAQMYEQEFRQALERAMKAHNVEFVENELFTATIRKSTTRTALDQKAFKAAHPKLAEQFMKTSPVKGGLVLKYHD